MGYSFESYVRYSETGEDGKLTIPGILNYFQDCCTFHSESIGQGMEVLMGRKRAWVLSSWQVIINRYPKLAEHITVTTAPYAFRGFTGNRNFTMVTDDGEMLAYANTFWTHINMETGLPQKLTPEDTEGYEVCPKLEMDYAPRKIAVPEKMQAGETFVVQKHHLDTNHHVNNCQYVCMAEDYLPKGSHVRQLRVEYKQQARLHDKIVPEAAVHDDLVTVALNDTEGKPYAVVEFAL